MNKTLSFSRVALMALALGTAGVTATFAQTTTPAVDTTPNPPANPADGSSGWHKHRHHDSVLTDAERNQLKAAKEKAFASNGDLKGQAEALHAQFKALKTANPPATEAQFEALHQQKESLHQQMRAAELAADPTLAPIFAKLDAAHQGHHHNA
jgi:Spy/CpxP family protein refolding chaperone